MDAVALSQFSKDELVATLLTQEARHTAEMAALRAQVAELERRLGLNSSNSGKPLSSDGLKKPLRVAACANRPGATLRRCETPDATIDHYPQACTACGGVLNAVIATDYIAQAKCSISPNHIR